MKTATDWYMEAINSSSDPKKSLEHIEKAIELNPNFTEAYYMKGIALDGLNQKDEAIKSYDKAISINPNFSQAYYCKGCVFHNMSKYDEAIALFDKAISIDPNFTQAYYMKGNTFASLKKYNEAIELFDKTISIDVNFGQAYYVKGAALRTFGKNDEALENYTKAIQIDSKNPLYYCVRGSCLSETGKQKEGLADYAKAQELIKSGTYSSGLSVGNLEYIEKTIGSIVELQKISDEVEAEMQGMKTDNPVFKKFTAKFQALKEEKKKVTNQVVENIDKGTGSQENNELEKLKKQFREELDAMKKDMANINTAVQELKTGFAEMKEELSTKMDDYKKKLDLEMSKLNLSEDDRTNIREYYRAFLETFSSIYVTSQVVDSGQVNLNTGNSATSVLSTLASFAPFVGDALSQGVKSIGEFLQSKKMKQNARKMKGIAADGTELSQLVGKAGFEIVLNPDKQKKILQVNEAEVAASSESLLQKIRGFCEKMQEQVDVFLYTRLYKTPAARLGHMDANELIGLWINDKISPYDTGKDLVEKIVSKGSEEARPAPVVQDSSVPNKETRSSCCNMF